MQNFVGLLAPHFCCVVQITSDDAATRASIAAGKAKEEMTAVLSESSKVRTELAEQQAKLRRD